MKKFAVIGNPIDHSKSPIIHKIFSIQNNIRNLSYRKICVIKSNFEKTVKNFFLNKGCGVNITLPFKDKAYDIVDELTERAKNVKSVNTIKYDNRLKILVGDNTDGIGLCYDLKRLNIINKNKKNNILIIGSGGAARGIIFSLINNYNYHQVSLTNRNIQRTIELFDLLKLKKLSHRINILEFKQIKKQKFSLIINATSGGIAESKLCLPENLYINKNTICYDLYYQNKGNTPFLIWCQNKGSKILHDGLGMLLGQAAYSFYFWHGIIPDIIPIIKILRKKYY